MRTSNRAELIVDTNLPNRTTEKYDISQSSRHSGESERSTVKQDLTQNDASSTAEPTPEQANEPIPSSSSSSSHQPQPSIRLLFSLISRRDLLTIVLPAVTTSLIAGGIAPFMTFVIGQTFDAFARFPSSGSPSAADRHALKHDVGIAALELVALAVGALSLSSVTSALWIAAGERNVMRLRMKVYEAVTRREMGWFDRLGASSEDSSSSEGGGSKDGSGAAGLMAKFAKDTDDVRAASSLTSGMLLQYLTTVVTALALAFSRSWSLTLLILSSVPALITIQTFSQRFAEPLFGAERAHTARSASLANRALSAIATLKAFNAQQLEQSLFLKTLSDTLTAVTKLSAVWGATSALSQFTTMAMFASGFWFGGRLIRKGEASPGDVMSVFWACLIATSNLQMCVPLFVTLAKGKFAMASLVGVIEEEDELTPPSAPTEPTTATSPTSQRKRSRTISFASTASSHMTLTPSSIQKLPVKPKRRAYPQLLRKIRPSHCTGEFSLHNVTFGYPSRPTDTVLRDVSLYFPARETTFVVGGSGSGKSTIAALLARLYVAQEGELLLDEQDVDYLDESWVREHVAVVSQSCILWEGSAHHNVAMGIAGRSEGRKPEDVTREEVVDVCTKALMHDFIRELPAGYDAMLGPNGAALSGGQKQRLAIARAMLRDPTVLILDEATSALDATSRILVFEAVRAWRKDKTTIVITHDLSQIGSNDFVYVLKDGFVAEQGYRQDLELPPTHPVFTGPDGEPVEIADAMDVEEGEFRKMMRVQGETGGFPIKEEPELPEVQIEAVLDDEEEKQEPLLNSLDAAKAEPDAWRGLLTHQSVGLNGWMLEVVQDLTRSRAPTPSLLPPPRDAKRDTKRFSYSTTISRSRTVTPSLLPPPSTFSKHSSVLGRSRSEKRVTFTAQAAQKKKSRRGTLKRAFSLQFIPGSPTEELPSVRPSSPDVLDDEDFELEKVAMERSGAEATKRRLGRVGVERTKWTDISLDDVKVDNLSPSNATSEAQTPESHSFIQLVRAVYPTVPNKPFILLGMVICVLSGVMTPLFSFLLSKLLFEVSIGATNVTAINTLGGIVLAVAAADGLLMGAKFFIMETGAMRWVSTLRARCYALLSSQDKAYFDKSENTAVHLVQVLIQDGDDARNLIAIVLGQFIVVTTMLSVGLIWALISGWQLTLAGLAIGPVFAVTMSVQANLCAKCERRNKTAREDVAKVTMSISNIRAIRCMSFEGVFRRQFDEAVTRAHSTGVQGAFVEGCTYGVANGLIYLAEALLFFVGAVLVANGTYTYLQMVEVLNLVVFSVTISSQLMQFTQKIAKATAATRDFNKLLELNTDTEESHGSLTPDIEGDIKFTDVGFAYPERSDVPVLQKTSLTLHKNECVAVVGASGSGKSTIAALLQRLYNPVSGEITIGANDIMSISVPHLRNNVSVVSQNPHLFDATVSDNIAYGQDSLTIEDVQRAARAAHVHDFIMSLPRGYDTMVGEDASLISGGQAQRLAIARALARPSKVLILDECTSALDPANQAAVMDSIRSAKIGRTTLVVTHKLPVMLLCDRIIVIHEGAVAEQGTYEELMQRNGVFAQLASGGEWSGE